ncbi:hypothetical protein [Adhaeribacter aquaticus]|uniref:hypothetical protein n=1 Tax=Adhaeribacter aquaticus TaxID=299567 RepID=UPI000420530F|nr:hypothetical protein [Adhaeribacter aquaticus]
MRNIDKLFILPLLAALTVGCSVPTSMQSSEYDDVYYTSKDKTIIQDSYVVAASQAAQNSAQAPTSGASSNADVQNPEYSARSGNATNNNNSQDYYNPNFSENDYYYASQLSRFHTPYIGRSYFDYGFTSNYWYNPRFLGSTFYDPFYGYGGYGLYDPFMYSGYPGWGWGHPRYSTNIAIMIGRPYGFGWGGLGYGMGYGMGFGNPYGGYNRYYNNFANSGYGYGDNNARRVQYGPRTDRSSVPGGGAVNAGSRPRGDIGAPNNGGMANPSGNTVRNGRRATGAETVGEQNQVIMNDSNLGRVEDINRGDRRARRIDNAAGLENTPAQLPNNGNMERGRRGRSYEIPSTPSGQPDNNINTSPAQLEQQPNREFRTRRMEQQPTYQPQQRQERTREIYRSEPTYQAPARTRSYEMPSSQPTYNGGNYNGGSRSNGGFGGGGGGGYNGGGGGGGGRRSR